MIENSKFLFNQKNQHIHSPKFNTLDVDSSIQKDFYDQFDIKIISSSKTMLEYDMIGLDPAIANALRRIMISEVPTMAIEHVFMINNTSIIQDEVIAHRLGLVPIFADPTKFDFQGQKSDSNEKNTIVFRMAVAYTYINKSEKKKVYSDALVWSPSGSELPCETGCRFKTPQDDTRLSIRPARPDIVLAMLSSGQEIVLEAHCTKGIGKEHAKWSPVATVCYRLLPEAIFLQNVSGDMAEKLSSLLPGFVKVIGCGHDRRAVLGSVRDNEILLEKFKSLSTKEEWAPYILLRKVKKHFIFTVETSGSLDARKILNQAIKILIKKIEITIKNV